ncbi:penicillin-binding protein activator [Andreprevotia sp. IGB-42]|uniref:penicillin-binding protein activator n=1 Tax=Andreprevotia sp. IGB-42 TaxID=2497473 RepID=UPI00135BB97A|nr:penicillin-binding protein activator [Andreprevotia sp. IGB-42]
MAAAVVAEPAAAAADSGQRFIALLLPLNSKAFKPAVTQLKTGVLAAEKAYGDGSEPPVRVFDSGEKDEDVLAQYNKAVNEGAAAVIGPLTRSAVNYLADNGSFPVPVVALNSFDEQTLRRPNLYSFSLSVEQEAASLARQLAADGVHNPAVLVGAGTLNQRMHAGFATAWLDALGSDPLVVEVGDSVAGYAALKTRLAGEGVDAIFLATNVRQARKLRPYLGSEVPIYASSQINAGTMANTALVDLTGVRYLEMPWLANPDDPIYAVFPRVRTNSADLERLFALGIDAWRVAVALSTTDGNVAIDGLSGTLSIGAGGVVQRDMQFKTISLPGKTPLPVADTHLP